MRLSRALRVGLTVALSAAFVHPLSAGATSTPDLIQWHKYVFSTPGGKSFYYPTTAKWSGAVQAGSDPTPDYPYRNYLYNVPNKIVQAVWEKTCPKDSQLIHLSRKVYIPGQPAQLFVSLYRAVHGIKPNPIKWMDLRINGKLVLDHVTGVHKQRISSLPTLPYDDNPFIVKITAKKAETAQVCNAGAASVGVVGEIWGTPASDVTADVVLPSSTYEDLSTSSTYAYDVIVTNNGPSDNPFGSTTYGTNFNIAVYTKGGDPIKENKIASYTDEPDAQFAASCSTSEVSSDSAGSGWSVNCRIPHLAPGKFFHVRFEATFTPRTCPYDPVPWTFTWNFTGLFDPNNSNGQGYKTLYERCKS